ncbi:MAG TPA: low molecular weight phosphotyrosine protein phosphatase, partial [Agromyces sp.]
DVPDPYYAGPGMFDEVLGMIESASRALFRQLEPAIRPVH